MYIHTASYLRRPSPKPLRPGLVKVEAPSLTFTAPISFSSRLPTTMPYPTDPRVHDFHGTHRNLGTVTVIWNMSALRLFSRESPTYRMNGNSSSGRYSRVLLHELGVVVGRRVVSVFVVDTKPLAPTLLLSLTHSLSPTTECWCRGQRLHLHLSHSRYSLLHEHPLRPPPGTC
jgi:hypothetical protein